jgi:hypothetical protein
VSDTYSNDPRLRLRDNDDTVIMLPITETKSLFSSMSFSSRLPRDHLCWRQS